MSLARLPSHVTKSRRARGGRRQGFQEESLRGEGAAGTRRSTGEPRRVVQRRRWGGRTVFQRGRYFKYRPSPLFLPAARCDLCGPDRLLSLFHCLVGTPSTLTLLAGPAPFFLGLPPHARGRGREAAACKVAHGWPLATGRNGRPGAAAGTPLPVPWHGPGAGFLWACRRTSACRERSVVQKEL
jgi:hypothetical protein